MPTYDGWTAPEPTLTERAHGYTKRLIDCVGYTKALDIVARCLPNDGDLTAEQVDALRDACHAEEVKAAHEIKNPFTAEDEADRQAEISFARYGG